MHRLLLTALLVGACTTDDGGVVIPPPPDDAGDSAVSATTLAQACHDHSTSYCNQEDTCFHKGVERSYGDVPTCISAVETLCNFAVSVPDAGWTGDSLEACVTARSVTICSDFVHGTNYPTSCIPRGGRADAASCLYGSQCQSGYCKIPGGQACGLCVEWAPQGGACTGHVDCQLGLRCAGNKTCQPAAPSGAACDDAHPCSPELYCDPTSSQCMNPGIPPAACNPALGGADCDSSQLAYCDAATKLCTPYALAGDGQACGMDTLCLGGEGCSNGTCTAGDQGGHCEVSTGLGCKTGLLCGAGVCSAMTYTCN